ncbi:hypothetical protein [Companilactobacillus mishanensis]|uniref:hypothetical protein n=1 Tax=Companilactobacillus mishanensis TaxID=2486008 RepID=UPI001295C49E|nr:hypothetical protein [Companilactobacillus mishanensis]MQS89800.1 hypothetical protein [Companilactobacillus mishanensis]
MKEINSDEHDNEILNDETQKLVDETGRGDKTNFITADSTEAFFKDLNIYIKINAFKKYIHF